MNMLEIYSTLDEAEIDDLIEIFVFRKPIQFCKERTSFDISEETKTLSLISKNGKTIEVINTNSIKFIRVKSPKPFGADPRSI